jgi:uncharacterized delta-60 repeat protein
MSFVIKGKSYLGPKEEEPSILIGGNFTRYDQKISSAITRLNADGFDDTTFLANDILWSAIVSIIVNNVTVQNDNKLLVGGRIERCENLIVNNLTRLNPDGTLDNTFSVGSGFNNDIYTIGLQSDGKILVGGVFTNYNGNTRNRLVRLNTDGTIDNTFNVGTGFNNEVRDLKIQSDGKIIVVGLFTTYNGNTRNRIVRLNTDGTIDNTFSIGTGFNNSTTTLSLQADEKILVGGFFSSYSGISKNSVIRLNTDGTIDETLVPWFSNSFGPSKIYVQSDGKILVGGNFTAFNSSFSIIRGGFFRMNSNGSIDLAFTSDVSNVSGIGQKSDGKIVIVGGFSIYNSTPCSKGFAILNTNGTLDTNTNTNPLLGSSNGSANSVTIQNDDKIIVTGGFNYFNQTENSKYFLKINQNALKDTSFNLGDNLGGSNLDINYILREPDKKLILFGKFDTYSGITKNNIVKLNTDGTIDNNFNTGTGFSEAPIDVKKQSDGKMVVIGFFTSYNGVNTNRILRLNTDGTLDNTFDSSVGSNSNIWSFDIQSDGKILVGGAFSTYNGNTRNRIVRLNTDGTIDNTFSIGTGFNGTIIDIKIQSDGKILMAGFFTTYNGNSRNRIIRLNTDGTIDNTFNIGTGFNDNTQSICLSNDNKILVGGDFTSYNGNSKSKLIRLNSNGSFDSTFNTSGQGFVGSNVSGVLDRYNRIYCSGLFVAYNNSRFNKLIRLNPNGSIDTTFNSGTEFGYNLSTNIPNSFLFINT